MSQVKTIKKRRRSTKPAALRGSCCECGNRIILDVTQWLAVRRDNYWPHCRKCSGNCYPVKRKCAGCNSMLRDGNFGTYCAVCERKRNGGDAEMETDE